MKAKIGMISQWYDPERGAAAVPGTIARSLVRQGHDVDVLTGFPNYPSGTIHDGYAIRPYKRETLDGVTVHRAALFPSHDTHPVRRAANYLSFSAAASPVALAKLANVDSVLVHSSPATAAIPALVLQAVRRKPFVLHIQDLWPQTVVSSGFLDDGRVGRVERILNRFCDLVYKRAHTIAVTSPGMAGLIAERGVHEDKITVVPNWTDEQAFRPVAKNGALAHELGVKAPLTVMYAGNFGEFQGIDVLIEAASLLQDRSDVGFVLVGGGIEETRLRDMVDERQLTNVTFVKQQPFERMADILALGDIQFVSLKDLPLFRTTLPSKLQATLAAGRPIVGAVAGDAANVIDQSGAGLVATPGSAKDLASAITKLLDKPELLTTFGASGRKYYEENFSESVTSEKLSDLLSAAAASGRWKR